MTPKEQIQAMPCMICNHPPPNTAHHVPSRGAGGRDRIEDMVPLCGMHHLEFHSTKGGVMTFARRYPEFMSWLKKYHPEIILKNLL